MPESREQRKISAAASRVDRVPPEAAPNAQEYPKVELDSHYALFSYEPP